MKKILCCILCVLMVFCLTACSDTPTKEIGSGAQTNAGNGTPKDETFSLNETAVFDDLKITATEIKETKGDDFFEPEDGKVFVGVKFTIENVSSEEQSISSILLFDAYADDVKCEYSFNAACAFDEGLDGDLAAGKKMIGWYAVEVPKEWQNIELEVKSSWLSSSSAKFVFEN